MIMQKKISRRGHQRTQTELQVQLKFSFITGNGIEKKNLLTENSENFHHSFMTCNNLVT